MGKKSRRQRPQREMWPDPDSATANRLHHVFALIATNSTDRLISDEDRKKYLELQELAMVEKQWRRIPRNQFYLLLYQQIMASAWDPDPDAMLRVLDLYKIGMHRLSNIERQHLAEIVAQRYSLFGNSFGRLFAPWSMAETDPSIIAAASLHFAHYFVEKRDDGTTLTGPEALALVIRERSVLHPGAVLGGLLMVGDRRTLPLLDGIWESLTPNDEHELTLAGSGFMYASTIEFLLHWMESVDDAKIGFPSVMLAQMRKHAVHDIVYDVERDVPVKPNAVDGVIRYINQWPALDYGKKIETRLRALADRETDEIVVPMVMHGWGLQWVPENEERRRLYEKTKSQISMNLKLQSWSN